jgi:H+/Cl- antiporter ClcA
MEIEILAGLGIFFGCFGRAMLPFLKKKAEVAKNGGSIRWEGRYIWTILFAIGVSFVATMFILPTLKIPSEYIFPIAFMQGWAAEDIINKIVK